MYYPHLSQLFSSAIQEIKGAEAVVLSHINPDGDSIGSSIALCRCLNDLGIHTTVANADPIPKYFHNFIGDTPLNFGEVLFRENAMACYVDCSSPSRSGPILSEIFPQAYISVDHHLSNDHYAKYNCVDSTSSATSEILAGIFLDNRFPIDPLTAQALYLGIATDTGQFTFPLTHKRTFLICAELIQRGAVPLKVTQELYEQNSLAKMKLLEKFLGTFRLEVNNKVCIGTIYRSFFDETHTTKADTEGFVDYARSIEGVKIGVLLEEKLDSVKGSLRSKEATTRVDLLANQWNGGGHACAAGFEKKGSLKDFYPDFIIGIEKHLRERVS